MSSESNYVTLTISRNSVGPSRAGFGTPLYLSQTATWTERVRTYTDYASVVTDFPDTKSPEVRIAAQLFGQDLKPTKFKIGRAALPATQVTVLSVKTVINLHQYQVNVKGTGSVPDTLVTSVATDGSATNDEAVALLVTALNLVPNKNYTAAATGAGGSQVVTITATVPGDWFSIEVVNVDELRVKSTHVDPGVATDLAAIKLVDNDWYGLITTPNSNAYVKAAAAWCNANLKLYIPDVAETIAIDTTSTGSADTLDDLKTLGYPYVAGAYHPNPAAMFAAAWYGRCFPLEPGSVTFALKSLNGVAAVNLTATHRANLVARYANSIEPVGSLKVTFDGKASNGEFLDVRRNMDKFADDASKSIFGKLATSDIVGFDGPGISKVESELRGALKRADRAKIFRSDWTVTVPDVLDVPQTDKDTRTLNGVKFTANLVGAIHKVGVNGNVVS